MALNAAPGSQVQGINVQGLEISKNHVNINIEWIDPDTEQHFDPSTYSVSITKDGGAYSADNLTIMRELSRRDDRAGYWNYAFLTQSNVATPVPMESGAYEFAFTGVNSATNNTVTLTLGFIAASIPIAQYFVGSLRARLGDRRASNYLVDDPTEYRWTDGDVYTYLEDSRMAIGNTPPAPTTVTYEQMYTEGHELLLTGGFIFALRAKGIFETFNAFNYNDELTLNIDRKVLFQNAASLEAAWKQATLAWKRDKTFRSLGGGIGMASGRFPLYYSRILSMVPHMQNTFYG